MCAIHDHRGHGASVKDTSHLGYFYTNDITYIVDDAYLVTEYLKNRYPTLSISIFSHSMGTLVSRNYLKKYEKHIEKIVLCGPPTENKLVDVALFAGRLTGSFYDEYKPNKILNKLSVGYYNKGYKNQNEWICSNLETVSSYNTDPLCGFTFTTSGFMNLFQLLKSAFIKKDWIPQNSSLPIFLIAGVDDPVIQGKEKFNELEEFLKEVGYQNIKSKLYKDKRHELLNETNKEIVYKDVLDFFYAN
ncbi:alpha/beta fold hydrolase [Catenibacterium sp.]|uniref:alpha/beta fold hydrolase n=1 Tax=Catenibacterium sp. TaxID=2049022 RepID=UPI003078E4CD